MKIDIITTVEVDTVYQADEIAKIFSLLIEKGALQGVKSGSANIHFDHTCKFTGIEFSYWPYRERT